MSDRDIERRHRAVPLYFANDTGSLDPDRRGRERRTRRRFRVHLWVEQRSSATESVEVLHVPEISMGGAFVVRAQPLDIGDRVELLINLPGHLDPIRPIGRVASIRLTPDNPVSPSGYGVFFVHMGEDEEGRLYDFLSWVDEVSQDQSLPIR